VNTLSSNVIAFAVGIPLVASVVGAVILSRPDGSSGAIAPATTATVAVTAGPTLTPAPPPAPPTRIAPTATATRPAAPTAAPEVLRPLSGIRFGMIDVISNSTGADLPFPAEFAMSAYFVLEPDGSRVRYGLDSTPFMPLLTGETATGPDWGDRGGHGLATGSGKFLGVTTDWTIDFDASETGLSALVSIGRSGNLPGGQPVELTVTVGEAWQAGP